MIYSLLTDREDGDIPFIHSIYELPAVSRFISIDENNYWRYVTTTENVYFYKIYKNCNLVGTTHCEVSDNILYMDLVVFPEYQNKGVGTAVIKDIQNEKLAFDYDMIKVSIDESNTASIRLFEKSGFIFTEKADELLEYVWSKAN